MSDERIDTIYQACYEAVEDKAERLGYETENPHPSYQVFSTTDYSIGVQLGEGLEYFIDGESVSEDEWRDAVDDSAANEIEALASMWMEIGKQQSENLSAEFLQRFE